MTGDNEIVIYTYGTHTDAGPPPDLAGKTPVDLCALLPDLVDAQADWPHPDDAQETDLHLQWDPRLEELSRTLVKQATDTMYGEALRTRAGLVKPPDFAVCCRDGRRLAPLLAAHLRRDLWLHGGGFDAKIVNLQVAADLRAIQRLAGQLDRMGTGVFEIRLASPAGPEHRTARGFDELAGLLGRASGGRTARWRLANFPTWITTDANTAAVQCPHCRYRISRSFDGSPQSAGLALVDLTVRAEHRHLNPARAR